MAQETAVQAPSKVIYKKRLIGYLGEYPSTAALLLKRNEKTVRIAVFNCQGR